MRSGKSAGRAHRSQSARHLGGQIHIEVRDDGRGIDLDAVRRKAAQQGLRTSTELANLGEKEVLSLILLPGFSTAAKVTDVSGRGVGMDVVKTNLDQLGGNLEMDSVSGRGTTFHAMRLPLTLAIVPCLLVTEGGERYAIPQKDLEELVCLDPLMSPARIEFAHDQEVVRLRDRLLPVVRLSEVLKRPAAFSRAVRCELPLRACQAADANSKRVYYAVVKVGSQRFGLVVEDILNTEEIVVKPMHGSLKPLAIYSGATVLGDGRITLILSMEGIARHAGVRFDSAPPGPRGVARDQKAETQTVLLFRSGPQEQFALPLTMIRRIVMVPTNGLERVGEEEFFTVDGVSTRVVRLDQFLSVSACVNRDPMFLLLPKGVQRPLGLLFSELIDTESLTIDLNTKAHQGEGVIGSALVRGRMTLIPDLYRLADMLDAASQPQALVPVAQPQGNESCWSRTRSSSGRSMRGYLEEAGYEVITANHGAEGLQELDRQEFDLVGLGHRDAGDGRVGLCSSGPETPVGSADAAARTDDAEQRERPRPGAGLRLRLL